MSLLSKLLPKIFEPLTDIVDSLHTSSEEKLNARAKLAKIEQDVTLHVIDLEGKYLEAQSAVVVAEAKSDSWLTRSWRPITMLVFVGIVVAYSLGFVVVPDAFVAEYLNLLKIGVGGYVVGRSGEKIMKAYKE